MAYLVEAQLTENELAWIDQQITRGRFQSRADAILALLGRGLESERAPTNDHEES